MKINLIVTVYSKNERVFLPTITKYFNVIKSLYVIINMLRKEITMYLFHGCATIYLVFVLS
jgi:hypothetical protein